MLKRKTLMESISSDLHSFLKKINKNLSLPSKKFLRVALIGLRAMIGGSLAAFMTATIAGILI